MKRGKKVGIIMGIVLLLSLLCEVRCKPVQSSSLILSMPELEITTAGDVDYAYIPGGEMLLIEEGRPQVPYYVEYIDYQKGYRVQDVVLRERSGLTTGTGLRLPVVILNPYPQSPVEMKGGRYPEGDYSWKVWINSDGSSSLTIIVYPFYYDPSTKEYVFYRNYEFEITCVFSDVSIIGLSSDESIYDPGDNITINVLLCNSGETNDIVASALIKSYGTDAIVEGLPLVMLRDLIGEASFSLSWDSTDFPAGDYWAEVTINDTIGNWLDRRILSFRVGRILVNVTGFSVEPTHFEVGQTIGIELEARNVGSCSASGKCIFLILKAGDEVERIHHNFTYLAPGESLRFSSTWNTSSAEEGAVYHVMGYVSYESQSTAPWITVVSTNLFPVAEFVFAPAKVGLGEVVTFDASASADPDGALASYEWAFGDGGNAIGSVVSHAYRELGLYEVSLTVTDDEGATGEVGQFLTVVMSYTLNVSSNVGLTIQGSGTYKEGDEVVLTAPTSTGMPGVLGLLGAKYSFREWVGALNSTEGTVRLVLTGYVPRLSMQAMYVEDYTGAIIVVSIAVIAIAIIVAIYIRKRVGRAASKEVPPPPPPPSAGRKAESLRGQHRTR